MLVLFHPYFFGYRIPTSTVTSTVISITLQLLNGNDLQRTCGGAGFWSVDLRIDTGGEGGRGGVLRQGHRGDLGTPQHADFDLAALEKLREVNLINFVLLATKIAVFWSNRERARVL